ncbi:AAA domain-containing protein [Aspergillus varians]
MHPSSIYIIGAQCTGKTTLVHALEETFAREYPSLHFHPIKEVARDVLKQHHFIRDDITNSPQRALELQQLIMAAQYEAESKAATLPILCDRSGVDPIVYAVKYGPADAQETLENSAQWRWLQDRMRRALVIVCPPYQGWLIDDGTRLMASNWAEWHDMHLAFIQLLQSNGIAFQVIPSELLDLEGRAGFVLRLWGEVSGITVSDHDGVRQEQ